MADKIDIEKLIDLVRHNPCLYDPKNPQYKDAIQTRNIWNSIGKALKITGWHIFCIYNPLFHSSDVIYFFSLCLSIFFSLSPKKSLIIYLTTNMAQAKVKVGRWCDSIID